MQRVSFGHKAHVQTTFGRVGTCHTPKFSSHFAHEAKKENCNRSHSASLTLIHERRRCSEAIARIPLSVSRRIGNRTRVRLWRSKARHSEPSRLTERPMSTT